MRKTLGKPGFLSGEDRNRTTREILGKTRHLLSCGAESGALVKTSENAGRSKPLMADPDLEFIIEAWPLLGTQANSQMIAMSRAARQEG